MPATTTVRVKATTDDTIVIEGYGVVFGGRDMYGDTFTPDTKFNLDFVPVKPVFYNHTQHNIPAARAQIGRVTKIEQDGIGMLVEAELDRKAEWVAVVEEMMAEGALGWSSGSARQFVEYEAGGPPGVIKAWTLLEMSLTPTPAEPRTMAPYGPGIQRKSAEETATSGDLRSAEDTAEAETQSVSGLAGDPVATVIEAGRSHEGEVIMTDEVKTANQAAEAGGGAELKALSDRVDQLLKLVEDSPLKSAGYITQDGGTADKGIKSFGDFLMAVKRGDLKRLEQHYGAIKALSEDAGATGGYLVPEEYNRRVMELAYRQEPWLARVTRFNVGSSSGRWPSLDVTFTPTAGVGQTAAAARLTGAKRAEAGAFTETTPQFTELEWKVNDVVSGYVKVSKELVADSILAVETLLTRLIGTADAAKQSYYFLQGNGVNEPLGILNSGAYLTQVAANANVFAVADAYAMIAKFQSIEGGVWVAHRTNMPDIGAVVSSTGLAYTNDANRQPGTIPILGYDVVWSEHLPVTDTTGSLLLIDPSAYYVWERGGLEIAFSEHADFTNGNVIWRFSRRLDGQPALKSTIKQGNPGTAHQMSPFVGFTFAT